MKMKKPITITYDFKMGQHGNDFVRRSHTCETYEEYHRCVRVLHENEDHYKIVSVERDVNYDEKRSIAFPDCI